MGITTDLARIKGNITAALAAIADKGVTVPDGSTSDALAGLIASIEVGGGSSIRAEQGSVTFAETLSTYTFVDDGPDIFIAYIEDDSRPTHSTVNSIWALIQNTIIFDYHGEQKPTMYVFGYSSGSRKYYVPYKSSYVEIGTFSSGNFNSNIAAKTYKYYAIYGVTAT